MKNLEKLLVGRRGTEKEISAIISKCFEVPNVDISRSEEQTENGDINYIFNLGEDGDTYLDFDLFVLETREEGVLYITEVNSIN